MSSKLPSKEIVESLRERYPKGLRVELVSMNDPYTELRPGDRGRVSFVDDAGSIFVKWDNGPGLGIVYGEDSVKRLEDIRRYEADAEFWRDTVSHHGEEATGICGNYLAAQLKTGEAEERQLCHELFVAMMEDAGGRADPAKLVYPYSFEAAMERSEVSIYHGSRERNSDCAKAIDHQINASCYKRDHYNLELAAMSVIQEHGFSRVNAVLAHNLQKHQSDGRYSYDNKGWANEFSLPDGAFDYAYLKAHPILLEDFTKYARSLYKELDAERFILPGAPEAGHKVQNYEITRSIWLDNQRGFAIGHSSGAPAAYVCWQFTVGENGKREFYWGHYCGSDEAAANDYIARTLAHMQDEKAREILSPLAAAEMSSEQNYNMIDGALNNEKNRLDLTDGQTHEEVRELAPEDLPQGKSSVMEQIREARKVPPVPHKPKDGHDHGEPSL